MPLVGCRAMGLHCIDDDFEDFEENVVREGFDCNLLKLAYITHT
jgi:hypothetical protein